MDWIARPTARDPAAVLAWFAGTCGVGFLVAFTAVDRVGLGRDAFVLVHLLVTGPWLVAYCRWAGLAPADLGRNPALGLVLAALAAAFSLHFVLSQPASPGPAGAGRLLSVLWLGVVYGTLDAGLLTVLPVHMVWHLARVRGRLERRRGWLGTGLAALAASMAVTVAYHLGFPEFRGAPMLAPVVGNSVFTLAYLLSASPLAPVIAHVAMHVAAVVHAPATSTPLPPH